MMKHLILHNIGFDIDNIAFLSAISRIAVFLPQSFCCVQNAFVVPKWHRKSTILVGIIVLDANICLIYNKYGNRIKIC